MDSKASGTNLATHAQLIQDATIILSGISTI